MGETASLGLKVDSTQVLAGAKALDKLSSSGKKVSSSVSKSEKSLKQLNATSSKAHSHVKKLDLSFRGLTRTMKDGIAMAVSMQIAMLPLLVALAVLAAAFKVVSSAIQTTADFSSAISDLSAITGATGKDLKFMSDAAKELGSTTTLTATQVATGFKLIASAKPDLLENSAALKQVTKEAITLAEAASIDMPLAANVLGTSLNQFGADADEAARFINVLAAGAKFGASEIVDTAAALKKAGVVAKSSGVSFEELNATLQVLAASGIKSEIAGTQLKTALVKLQVQSNNDFNPAIVGIAKAFKNMNEAQLSTIELEKLVGLEALTVAQILAGGADKIQIFTDKLTGTNTAAEQAATKMKNLRGDYKKFKSVLEKVAINITEDFEPALRKSVQTMTEMLKVLDTIIDDLPKLPDNVLAQIFGDPSGTILKDLKEAKRISDELLRVASQDITGAKVKLDKPLKLEDPNIQLKNILEVKKTLFDEEVIAAQERDLEILDNQSEAIDQSKALTAERIQAEDDANKKRIKAEEKFHQLKRTMEITTASMTAGLLRQAAGGNKAALIAALAIEKAIAASRVIINTEAAVAAARAANPFDKTAGVRMRILGNIQLGIIAATGVGEAAGILGQAHDGLATVPNTGTFILEKGERVVKKEDNKKLTQMLESGGDGGFTQVINIDARGSADVESVVRRAAEEGGQRGYERSLDDLQRGGPMKRAAIA